MTQVSPSVIILNVRPPFRPYSALLSHFVRDLKCGEEGVGSWGGHPRTILMVKVCSQVCFSDRPEGAAMLRGACLLHVFTRCEPGTTVADVRIWLLGQLYESGETANKSQKHTPLFKQKKEILASPARILL